MDRIYLDHSATTATLPCVWEAMRPYFTDVAGNPASSHRDGQKARQALEHAREVVASLLGAHADEVIFTSGATEANNLAIFGFAGSPPGHVVTSSIEHPCVLEPMRRLAETGYEVSTLPITGECHVESSRVAELVRPDTRLLAIMLANHETGAVQPIEAIAEKLPAGVSFHCDAAAAAGKLRIDFHSLGVTSLALSGHKFHGPVGIGALVVRRGAKLKPQLLGGHQQQGRRPGTEPVALVVGLAAALQLAMSELEERRQKVVCLRRRFLAGLRSAEPFVVNGGESAVPETLNVSFPGCRADVLVMKLDLAGVSCSTGAACSSGSMLPSPVLKAMHVPAEVLHSAVRFSFSHVLTEVEIDHACDRIVAAAQSLRASGTN